jgi:hypothetical protein
LDHNRQNSVKEHMMLSYVWRWVVIIVLMVIATLGVQASTVTQAGTEVSGTLTSDTIWSLENSPYILRDGPVTVAEGVKLTIQPGVVVQGANFCCGSARLVVRGDLDAQGTAAQPIIFTSALNTGPGEWAGLFFDGGAGHLNYTIVRYGGRFSGTPPGEQENVFVYRIREGGELLIENSRFAFSSTHGMRIEANALGRTRLLNNHFANNTKRDIRITGSTLAFNTRLAPQQGAAYLREGRFTIPTDVTLALEPGVTFKVANDVIGGGLVINGRLEALGTPTQPITLTSGADTAQGEGPGLIIDGGTAHMRHATIRYAGNTISEANIKIVAVPTSGEVLIENSLITQSNKAGIKIESGRLSLYCVAFTNNADAGLLVDGNDPLLAQLRSSYNGNSIGLHNRTDVAIDARNSWWGSANGPGTSNGVVGNVAFEPWLNSEPNCAQTGSVPGPEVAVNYPIGAPGSYFTLRGKSFSPNTQLTIQINGLNLAQVTTNGSGAWSLILDSNGATAGEYTIRVVAPGQELAQSSPEPLIQINPNALQRGRETIAAELINFATASNRLFLPLVMR